MLAVDRPFSTLAVAMAGINIRFPDDTFKGYFLPYLWGSWRVSELKKVIEQDKGIPAFAQFLYHGNQRLADHRTLGFYQIQQGDVIVLELVGPFLRQFNQRTSTASSQAMSVDEDLAIIPPPADPPRPPDRLQIRVKHPGGYMGPFEVSKDDTVLALKQLLHLREGSLPERQRLLLDGRVLDDARTLDSYGVQTNEVIRMVVSIGGAPNTPTVEADERLIDVLKESSIILDGSVTLVSVLVNHIAKMYREYAACMPGSDFVMVAPPTCTRIRDALKPLLRTCTFSIVDAEGGENADAFIRQLSRRTDTVVKRCFMFLLLPKPRQAVIKKALGILKPGYLCVHSRRGDGLGPMKLSQMGTEALERVATLNPRERTALTSMRLHNLRSIYPSTGKWILQQCTTYKTPEPAEATPAQPYFTAGFLRW